MTIDLLPCPFCMGEARYQVDHTTECRDSVWCGACDYGMFDPDEQGSVVAAWNRRADLTPSPEVVRELLEALRKLHHAVCGETGFAACVRMDSGKAYPWPALDEADAAARAALAKMEGGE